MKPTILFVLLALWIFAIVAPSVSIVLDRTDSSYTMMILAEEEPQEQEGNTALDADEKQIVYTSSQAGLFYCQQYNTLADDSNRIIIRGIYLEIPIPPPDTFA